ncbi:uncharacterized protein [Amphiura filiformis]|uniref:uncharacterized protein n=1 Tax=Amphiura filiformis TaxID=82378 RepID=UPI003B227840
MKAKYRMQGIQNRVQAPPSRITKNTLLLQPFQCRYCLRWWSNFERYRKHTRSHRKWRSRISEVQKGVRLCQNQNTEQVALVSVVPGNGFQQTKSTIECDKCKKHFLKLSAFHDHKCISDSGSTHQAIHVQPKCKCAKGFATHDPLKEHSYSNTFIHNSHSTCDHCKRGFGKNLSLKRHLKMHDSVDFATEDNWQQTRNVSQISVAYECDKCSRRFLTLSVFDDHKCISDSQSGSTHQASGIQPKCNHCNMSLAAKSDVARHEKRQHSLLQWMCRKCGMGFATNDDLNEHKTIHADEASDTSQPREDETEYRNKVASSLVAIECDKCWQQFPSLVRFNSHKCISDTRNGVAIHLATSIPRKRNSHPQCEHCNSHFGTKPNLERTIDAMGFATKDNLEKTTNLFHSSNRTVIFHAISAVHHFRAKWVLLYIQNSSPKHYLWQVWQVFLSKKSAPDMSKCVLEI